MSRGTRSVCADPTAIDAGTWIDPTAGKVTLEVWATEWQRSVVHLRPKTRKIYADNLRLHVLPVLGRHELAKLTPSMLRAWQSDLASRPGVRGKVLSASSVSQAYRTLNRILEAAVVDEILGRNPLKGVTPPVVESKEMRFLTHEEVALLADTIDERYRALVLVADELDAHLRSHAEPAADAMVFPSPDGGYLRFDNFRNRVWAPATVEAGLAPLRPHDLRHTCASLAIAAGADIKVLQRMLGHSSAVLTLDRYGHMFPGQAESVADRLDEMARAAGVVQRAEVVSIDRSGT